MSVVDAKDGYSWSNNNLRLYDSLGSTSITIKHWILCKFVLAFRLFFLPLDLSRCKVDADHDSYNNNDSGLNSRG